MLTPTNGEVLINGKKIGVESKKIVSYLPDEDGNPNGDMFRLDSPLETSMGTTYWISGKDLKKMFDVNIDLRNFSRILRLKKYYKMESSIATKLTLLNGKM